MSVRLVPAKRVVLKRAMSPVTAELRPPDVLSQSAQHALQQTSSSLQRPPPGGLLVLVWPASPSIDACTGC